MRVLGVWILGILENSHETPESGYTGGPPKCKNCGEQEQTNWVKPLDKSGKEIPFMELSDVKEGSVNVKTS